MANFICAMYKNEENPNSNKDIEQFYNIMLKFPYVYVQHEYDKYIDDWIIWIYSTVSFFIISPAIERCSFLLYLLSNYFTNITNDNIDSRLLSNDFKTTIKETLFGSMKFKDGVEQILCGRSTEYMQDILNLYSIYMKEIYYQTVLKEDFYVNDTLKLIMIFGIGILIIILLLYIETKWCIYTTNKGKEHSTIILYNFQGIYDLEIFFCLLESQFKGCLTMDTKDRIGHLSAFRNKFIPIVCGYYILSLFLMIILFLKFKFIKSSE
jgi:hypothetical protein